MKTGFKLLSQIAFGAFLMAATVQLAHSDEEAYVHIQVPIEIRGILKQTKDGLVVETRERVLVHSLRPAKNEWEYNPRIWELDMHLAGKYKELIRDLEGKTVIVEGVAPLYQVETYNSLGGGHHPVASLSWRVERKLRVLLLKSVESQP